MEFTEGKFYHLYNRGNNKQQIFFSEENYLFFLRKIRTEILPFCEILSYCLMPNHFHFIIYIKDRDTNIAKKIGQKSLNKAIAIVLRSYTRALQKQECFTGSLFQQKTKAKKLEINANDTINYLSICTHYIHQNPLKAGLITDLKDWKFSSYLDYIGMRNGSLCNQSLFYEHSGIEKDDFIREGEHLISEKMLLGIF
ncbi:transposase [Pedobacter cryotolerans]|nr:transposase [Pedobacter cryotolerans]